jgi:hypothetical protein
VDLVAQQKESGESLALRDILSIFLQARLTCTRPALPHAGPDAAQGTPLYAGLAWMLFNTQRAQG